MTVFAGEQLQASPPYFGVWTGNPTAFSFQWQDSLDGENLNGTLAGETRSDYIAAVTEAGRWVRVAVTASNAGGNSEVAYSSWYGPVTASSEPPPPTDDESTVLYGIAVVDGKPVFVQVRPN